MTTSAEAVGGVETNHDTAVFTSRLGKLQGEGAWKTAGGGSIGHSMSEDFLAIPWRTKPRAGRVQNMTGQI